jgi:RimJ/RimL family protein N-acetyltransferase
MALRSDRLELRTLDANDAKFVELLYANRQVTQTLLRIQAPISLEAARELCEAPTCGDHRFGAVLRVSRHLIGLGSVRRHPETPIEASVGYSILPAFWRQGFGTELAALLVDFATGTLRVREVHATTLEDNPASSRVLEKLGFTVREMGGSEVDSRGHERRVTRWVLERPAEDKLERSGSTPAAQPER